MKEKMHRFTLLFIAILFIVTAVGVGAYAFLTNSQTAPGEPADNYIKCPVKAVTAKQDKKDGKLEGAKLAGFMPIKKVDYLKCEDLKLGSGATATAASTITATYTGALAADGTIFESSEDTGQPITTQLSGVIPGWTAGVPGMKVGGQRRLIIPAQYAYGPQASAKIPANADLVFDITLLSIQ